MLHRPLPAVPKAAIVGVKLALCVALFCACGSPSSSPSDHEGGGGSEAQGGGAPTCEGIDLQQDPDHCGACGHSCFGGACESGLCQPSTLVETKEPLVTFDLAGDRISAASFGGELFELPAEGGALVPVSDEALGQVIHPSALAATPTDTVLMTEEGMFHQDVASKDISQWFANTLNNADESLCIAGDRVFLHRLGADPDKGGMLSGYSLPSGDQTFTAFLDPAMYDSWRGLACRDNRVVYFDLSPQGPPTRGQVVMVEGGVEVARVDLPVHADDDVHRGYSVAIGPEAVWVVTYTQPVQWRIFRLEWGSIDPPQFFMLAPEHASIAADDNFVYFWDQTDAIQAFPKTAGVTGVFTLYEAPSGVDMSRVRLVENSLLWGATPVGDQPDANLWLQRMATPPKPHE